MQQIWQNIRQTSLWLWGLVAAAALLNFALPVLLQHYLQGQALQRATVAAKLAGLTVAVIVCILVLTERI